MKSHFATEKSLFLAFLLAFSVGLFNNAQANQEEGHEGEKKELNVSEVIIEHVLDNHVWHLTDGLVIPLPVIVYSEEYYCRDLLCRFPGQPAIAWR